MKNLLFVVTALFIISSCNVEKKDAVVSQSPDGNVKVSVSGKRESPLTGWNINIVAEGKGLKGNISFEFFGSDLNDKTVQFVWEGNEKCTITFLQKDDTKRVFLFTPNSAEAMWTDLSEK